MGVAKLQSIPRRSARIYIYILRDWEKKTNFTKTGCVKNALSKRCSHIRSWKHETVFQESKTFSHPLIALRPSENKNEKHT